MPWRLYLADPPKLFTGSKGMKIAEPAHTLDFKRIERGINLVVPLFANGLQLRHDDPLHARVKH